MKKLWLHIILLAGLLVQAAAARAQEPRPTPIHPAYGVNDTLVVYGTVMPDGTIVPTSVLPDVWCYGKLPQRLAEKMKEWTRLRNAVYVCYPYAKEAGKIINEVNAKLAGVTDDKERKKIIKAREKDMRKSFTSKITDLSVYQGKVLMKLINRETGNNCFEILKEYKGGFNAVLYQSIAFVFGSNLKQSYEPTGTDRDMEVIVKDVEKLYRG
ncbi:MAG: DUF4294 domain-containing protein [Chitinophagaceae bacterium]